MSGARTGAADPGTGELAANALMNALANRVSLGLRNHGLSFLSAEPPCGPVRLIYFAPVLPAFFFSFSSL